MIEQGVSPARITLITNGVDLEIGGAEGAPPAPAPVPADAFVAMYVGAHGTYSSLETVLDAADRLRDLPEARIVLVGGGDRKPALVEEATRRGLGNVVFIDSVPKREVPSWLARADVCLLPYQDNPLFAGALPNKAFDYLGAARPIIAAAPAGELTAMVERAGCGVAVPPEDGAALAAAIRALAADRDGAPGGWARAAGPTRSSTTTAPRWRPASSRWSSRLPSARAGRRARQARARPRRGAAARGRADAGDGRHRVHGAARLARARRSSASSGSATPGGPSPSSSSARWSSGPRAWEPGWP